MAAGDSCVKVPSATEFRFPKACITSDNSWAEMLDSLDLVLLHMDVCLWAKRESHALEFAPIRYESPMWELAAFSPDVIARLFCSYNERRNIC